MFTKRLLQLTVVAVGMFSVFMIFYPQQASAYSGSGYFSGSTGEWFSGCAGDVFSGRGPGCDGPNALGSAATGSKSGFINFIKRNLSGGGKDKVGAAFVINEMVNADAPGNWPKDRTPSAAMIADWESRINSPDVTMDVLTRDPNSYGSGRISFYDAGINDDFYTNYNAGPRPLLIFYENGRVRYVIEVWCGNPIGGLPGLPEVPEWGPMDAESKANKATVKPGRSITWHHTVWNTGSLGNDQTETIAGDVFWGGGTTGPIPAANRYGGGKVDNPKLNYSRKFIKGKANGRTLNYTFTVPASAKKGDRYCQNVTYKPTSSKNSAQGQSRAACVRVDDDDTPPPTGGDVATCTLTLSSYGPIEVSTLDFTADYQATVTSTRTTKDTRTNPPSWGSWSSWSGWSGSDTNQTRQRTRTATAERVYYRVVKAHFTSTFDGSNTPSGRTSPDASGSLSPFSTSHSFPYDPEDDAGRYTVGGEFSYEVEKVVEQYRKTQTETERRTRTKRANGTYTAWVVRTLPRSETGWVSTSTDRDTVGSGTVDCGNDEIVYAYRPYMDVYGGDILAGAYQMSLSGPGCTQVSSAGISGWNHNKNEAYNGSVRNDFAGAGAEAGAFALANIKSFSSALNGSSGPNGPASGLSFANTSGYVAGTTYGGNFGSIPLSCNFAEDLDDATTISSNYGGSSSFSGKHTYKATGNVYISGNVEYGNSGGWTKADDIPRFKLLVTGDIYIDNDVTQLDGFYVATGNIYTCATSNGNSSNDYDTCNNQLRVIGAFAAKKIHFLRTVGTLRDASPSDDRNSGNIGETFIYTPELWLPNEPSTEGLKYDSILGLPPVL